MLKYISLSRAGWLSDTYFCFSAKDDWNAKITNLRNQVEDIFRVKFGKLKLNELFCNAAAF